jgi:DNA-binding NtrC family response regulator
VTSQQPVLIVDDDESVTASLSLLLKQAGLRSVSASGPAAALELLNSAGPSMVVQDMNFSRQTSGEEGLDLLGRIKELRPNIPVVLITAWGSIELAVQGMKAGATDFVTKPWNNQHVLQIIQTALQLADTGKKQQNRETRESLDEQFDFSDSIGEHPSFIEILSTVGRVCTTDAPVLILGESGTGKELIANSIHRNSQRADGPMVKVNLGGIPSSLFESEMFGHTRGAFTDAVSDRTGRFELANGGTIFLDEAGDLDRASQVKLLRVLEDRTFQPVGSSDTRQTNVRVISATNRDLNTMIQEGTFREDLLYRLNLITIRLPALRERRSDIRRISTHHLHKVAEVYSVDEISVEENAWCWLESLEWPGNIRQLCQTLERAVLMSGKSQLAKDDFVDPDLVDESVRTESQLESMSPMTLDEMEKLMIERSLTQYGNNISQVASALGLSRAALYRRLEKYQLNV